MRPAAPSVAVLVAALLGTCLLLAGCRGPGASWSEHAWSGRTADGLLYRIDVPADARRPAEGWPLLLFLHGAGERGDDLAVGNHGPLQVRNRMPELQEAVILSPQCPAGRWWRSEPLLALLDEVQADLEVDPSRVYVTGYSMGGYGTWNLLSKAPDRFAAAVVVSGGGDPKRRWPVIPVDFSMDEVLRARDVPIRAFHGADDGVVPVEENRLVVDALHEAGARDLELAVYEDVGHDAWTRTYAEPELWRWLFAQRRPSMPDTWTAFRGNALHTGRALGARAIASPELAWTFDTGGTVESSPAVVDGRLYCGTFADHLFCLDAETGAELWRFPVGGLVRASPSVANGLVYFGADDNRFYALDAVTGEPSWSVELGDGGQQSSPTIADGLCWFGGFDHRVYAVDALTGDVRWTFDTGGEILSSPAVADGLLAIGSRDGNVYGLDAATGAERWRFVTGNTVWSSPAIADGVVFVGSDDRRVYAIDGASGEERWRFETGGTVFSSPAVALADGALYIGSDDHHLYALRLEDGTELWRSDLGGRVLGSPAIVVDHLYVGGEGSGGDLPGALFALERGTGERVWRFEVGETVWSSPTAALDSLWFGAHDGKLRRLREAR